MAAKMGLRRAWEMMGMRLHMQQSADLMTVASSAGEVQGFLDPVYQRRMRGEHEDPEGTDRPKYPTPDGTRTLVEIGDEFAELVLQGLRAGG